MKKCNYCNVEAADGEQICPLCQISLDTNQEKEEIEDTMYPEIEFNIHKFNIITRLFLFLSIVLGIVLIQVNYLTYDGVWWSAVSTGVLVYFWLTILYSIRHNTNAAAKILVQSLAAQALCLICDFVWGYRGWSVNYAIPAIILAANGSTLILLIVNFMNWQSYILFQLEYVFYCIVLVILFFAGVITNPIMTFAASGVSVLILIGIMIFGDRKAKNELKRRFHI